MSMKKYVDLTALSTFLENLKNIFADKETVLYKTPQELTLDEANQVRENIHSVGQQATGYTYYPFTIIEIIDYDNFNKELSDPVVAVQGAEIYNDYENNIATGMYAIARGCGTQALGDFSDASGWLTKATGFCAIASGRQTEASGQCSHAEGYLSKSTNGYSHAEGEVTVAQGGRSHSEGYYTQANGNQSHSEGAYTVASGVNSHAEGWKTTASGQNAFSGGKNTLASGVNSTAKGLGTIAAGAQQTALGKYNISDTTNLFIIGNGTSDTARSNAFTLDSSGNAEFAGDVIAYGCGGEASISLTNINTSVQSIQNEIGDGFEDITSEEIKALFGVNV